MPGCTGEAKSQNSKIATNGDHGTLGALGLELSGNYRWEEGEEVEGEEGTRGEI